MQPGALSDLIAGGRERQMIALCLWNWNCEQGHAWAWWDEVPDLVLASVCDPSHPTGVTELGVVNCGFGLN